jgi:capsid portal protein
MDGFLCVPIKRDMDIVCSDVENVRYCKQVESVEQVCVPQINDMVDAWKRLAKVIQGLKAEKVMITQ